MHPYSAVIGLVQTADDDTPAGTGMDETVIFQIDAYMGGCTFVLSVMKEYKVAFLKLAFAYLPAVLFSLVVGVAFQMLVVDFLVMLYVSPEQSTPLMVFPPVR